MEEYIKLFNNHDAYTAFTQTEDFVKPNVSLCVNENEVHYNPWTDPRLIAKFNVTNTSNPTNIINNNKTSYFSEIEIDGVVQPSVVSTYTFDTIGEHTVKYTLSDPTSIGTTAFSGCSALTNVTIPNSVTTIGYSVFYGTNLTNIIIPSSVTTIGGGCFQDCNSLTTIKVDSENNVYDSRDNCNAIIETATNKLIVGCKSTVIPNTVTSIGTGAFRYNRNLTSIGTIGSGADLEIPNSVTSIGDDVFEGCYNLTSVIMPNSITSTGETVFAHCSGLTSVGGIGSNASVEISSGITKINRGVFQLCDGLTTVTIPNTVTNIDMTILYSCRNLTEVIISSNVTRIGSSAFRDCSNLTSVIVEAATPPTLDSNVFSNNASGRKIYVPAASVETYKAASGWSSYAADIEAIPTT